MKKDSIDRKEREQLAAQELGEAQLDNVAAAADGPT